MNAPIAIPRPVALGDVHDFIECCDQHVWFCNEGWISLHTAVDNLQALAERWGLVDEIGQDEVQRLMANAFAPAASIDLPADYAAQIVRLWELADPRDSWKHTGEPPPAPVDGERKQALYTPARSTIDAFWFVVRQGDPDHLMSWLAQHPADAPHLHEIWGRKCSIAAA